MTYDEQVEESVKTSKQIFWGILEPLNFPVGAILVLFVTGQLLGADFRSHLSSVGSWVYVLLGSQIAVAALLIGGVLLAHERARLALTSLVTEAVPVAIGTFPVLDSIVEQLRTTMRIATALEIRIRLTPGIGASVVEVDKAAFVILSPSAVGLVDTNPDALAGLLAHELGHVRHGDTGNWVELTFMSKLLSGAVEMSYVVLIICGFISAGMLATSMARFDPRPVAFGVTLIGLYGGQWRSLRAIPGILRRARRRSELVADRAAVVYAGAACARAAIELLADDTSETSLHPSKKERIEAVRQYELSDHGPG